MAPRIDPARFQRVRVFVATAKRIGIFPTLALATRAYPAHNREVRSCGAVSQRSVSVHLSDAFDMQRQRTAKTEIYQAGNHAPVRLPVNRDLPPLHSVLRLQQTIGNRAVQRL